MNHTLDLAIAQQRFHQGSISDIALHKLESALRAGSEDLPCRGVTSGEIVKTYDVMTGLHKGGTAMRPDVSGSTSNQHIHACSLGLRTGASRKRR